MIGKITRGSDFSSLCKYVLDREEASIIDSNLVESSTSLISKQFEATQDLNYLCSYPVCHLSVSFARDERPNKETVIDIGRELLDKMGYENNLFLMAEHNDTAHYHIHMIASRISFAGELASTWMQKRRCENILRELEEKHDLTPVSCSRNVDTSKPSTGQARRIFREQREYEEGKRNRPPDIPVKIKLQNIIGETIDSSNSLTLNSFMKKLEKQGVNTKIKISDQGEVQGISYALESYPFAGRKLGRNDRASTIPALKRRGVKIDLKQIRSMIEHSDINFSQKMVREVMNHPNNRNLFYGREASRGRD